MTLPGATILTRLQPGRPELEELIDLLVVPETWFFRDRGAFDYLRSHVEQKLLQNPGQRVVQVLSAPCSTGEEAFSIAATLLTAGLDPAGFWIDAVDVSARAIETAQRATYRRSSFRERGTELEDRFFEKSGEFTRVSPEIVSRVRFQRVNLLEAGWPTEGRLYDVIFCKNLLIYLSKEARDRVVRNLARLLREDGVLFVGHSEIPLFQRAGYRPVASPRSFVLAPAPKDTRAAAGREAGWTPRTTPPARIRPDRPIGRSRPPSPSVDRAPALENGSPLAKARELADQGQLEQAASVCETMLSAACMDPDVYYLAGLINQARDRGEEAEQLFLKASYLDPEHYESLVQLCLLSERKGESGRSSQYRDRVRRIEARRNERTPSKANA